MIFDLFDSPELLEVQRAGFYSFLKEGVSHLLAKEFPIEVKNGRYLIELSLNEKGVKLIAPEDTPRDCILKMKTYNCKLYAQVKVICKKPSGTILYQSLPEWVLLGQLPIMTKRGHFIINGSPRVIVHQVVRAPGIYFQKAIKRDDQNRSRFYGDIIPLRGAWLRLQMTKKGRVEAKFKKGKKVEVEFLQKCLQIIENQTLSFREDDQNKSQALQFKTLSSDIASPTKQRLRITEGDLRAQCIRVSRFAMNTTANVMPVHNAPYPLRGKQSAWQSKAHAVDYGERTQITSFSRRFVSRGVQGLKREITAKDIAYKSWLAGKGKNKLDALQSSALYPFSESVVRLKGEHIPSRFYEEALKVFSKKNSRVESRAEDEAFVHTYDKLYRTTQDKELEEWQKKKKNRIFFKGPSLRGFASKVCEATPKEPLKGSLSSSRVPLLGKRNEIAYSKNQSFSFTYKSEICKPSFCKSSNAHTNRRFVSARTVKAFKDLQIERLLPMANLSGHTKQSICRSRALAVHNARNTNLRFVSALALMRITCMVKVQGACVAKARSLKIKDRAFAPFSYLYFTCAKRISREIQRVKLYKKGKQSSERGEDTNRPINGFDLYLDPKKVEEKTNKKLRYKSTYKEEDKPTIYNCKGFAHKSEICKPSFYPSKRGTVKLLRKEPFVGEPWEKTESEPVTTSRSVKDELSTFVLSSLAENTFKRKKCSENLFSTFKIESRYDLGRLGREKINKKFSVFTSPSRLLSKPNEINSRGTISTRSFMPVYLSPTAICREAQERDLHTDRSYLPVHVMPVRASTRNTKGALSASDAKLSTVSSPSYCLWKPISHNENKDVHGVALRNCREICASKGNIFSSKKRESKELLIKNRSDSYFRESTTHQLTASDLCYATLWLYRLRKGEESTDDIDHSQNRRVRTSGELFQSQFENGVYRLKTLLSTKLQEWRGDLNTSLLSSIFKESYSLRYNFCPLSKHSSVIRLAKKFYFKKYLCASYREIVQLSFTKKRNFGLFPIESGQLFVRHFRKKHNNLSLLSFRLFRQKRGSLKTPSLPCNAFLFTSLRRGAKDRFSVACKEKSLRLSLEKQIFELFRCEGCKVNRIFKSHEENYHKSTLSRRKSDRVEGSCRLNISQRFIERDYKRNKRSKASDLSLAFSFSRPISKESKSSFFLPKIGLCRTFNSRRKRLLYFLGILSCKVKLCNYLTQKYPYNFLKRSRRSLWIQLRYKSMFFVSACKACKKTFLPTRKLDRQRCTSLQEDCNIKGKTVSIRSRFSTGRRVIEQSCKLKRKEERLNKCSFKNFLSKPNNLSLTSGTVPLSLHSMRFAQRPFGGSCACEDLAVLCPLGASRACVAKASARQKFCFSLEDRHRDAKHNSLSLREIRKERKRRDSNSSTVKDLFSTKPITGALREFFGSNPLSQYMDQTNPLAEITHKRRISSLGVGGVSRESAGMAIRGIHPTHYGRICPIETPEGKNAGLVNSLAFYTKVDKDGFLKTPYYRVFKGQVQSALGFSFCSAKNESLTGLQVAPSDLQRSQNNILRTKFSLPESVPVRVTDNFLDVFKKENPYNVEAIAISPIQMISVATSLIPFLEHNDANRALMGSNMQRQAVPLMISERPVVGTGFESRVIVESGQITESPISGFVSHVTAREIVVDRLLSKTVKSFAFSRKIFSFSVLTSLREVQIKVLMGMPRPYGRHVMRVIPRRCVALTNRREVCASSARQAQRKTKKQSSAFFLTSLPVQSFVPPLSKKQISACTDKSTICMRIRREIKVLPSKTFPCARFLALGRSKAFDVQLLCDISRREAKLQSVYKSNICKASPLVHGQENERSRVYKVLQYTCPYTFFAPSGDHAHHRHSKDAKQSARNCAYYKSSYTATSTKRITKFVSAIHKAPYPLRGKQSTSNADTIAKFYVSTRKQRCSEESDKSKNSEKQVSKKQKSLSLLFHSTDIKALDRKRSCLIPTFSLLTTFSRSNQNTCITEKPLVKEFDWVQKGDILTDCSASNNGCLAVGKNVLLAYIPWEGYNFEDAIVISDRLVREHVYTSLHIERYVFQAQDLKEGSEWFTKHLPGVEPSSIEHLEESGLPKSGSFLKEGDIIVGKIRYLNKKPSSPYERLLCDILGEKNFSARNKSLYVPKGVEARVVYHKVISFFENDPENKVRPLDAAKTIHIFLGEKRVIQVGDKISGRHGNKGVISTILSRQDMPYLPDGTPIDVVLNPLGVPSRMNVGQVLECLLGLAASYLNQHFKTSAFDERYGVEASKSIVFLKLYQARLMSGQNWLFQVSFPGKTRLIDGRSGECFDQWITVGKAYILKLIHMVSEKIHARSTGPYALITQQPLRGRSNKGGQRLGEMEVWALEGFGAAYTLQELLTKKSDDFFGRKQIVDSILPLPTRLADAIEPSSRIDKNRNVLGHPEIFKVLLCELQALCLDLGVYVLTPESFQRTFLGVVD